MGYELWVMSYEFAVIVIASVTKWSAAIQP
jgi:hypothetical protein